MSIWKGHINVRIRVFGELTPEGATGNSFALGFAVFQSETSHLLVGIISSSVEED
jgi:hypothetical protein